MPLWDAAQVPHISHMFSFCGSSSQSPREPQDAPGGSCDPRFLRVPIVPHLVLADGELALASAWQHLRCLVTEDVWP